MNEEEIRAKLALNALEMRKLLETLNDTSQQVNIEEARAKQKSLEEERSLLEKQFAELQKPAPEQRDGAGKITNRDFIDAAKEMRSITIGSNGSIYQVKEIVEALEQENGIIDGASWDYGPNASTNIPVLEPTLADPSGYAEGATTVAEDSTAALTTTEIQPKAYASVLPVTAEQITMGSVDFVSKLPELFRKAFRRTMHTGMMTGDGTSKNIKGIFVSAAANTAGKTSLAASQTKIKCSDLAGLALNVAGLDADFEIVMHPTTYQGVLSDSTSGEDTKEYKTTLIRDKMIEGVRVRLDKKAPYSTAAGSILAVAFPVRRYHFGIAGEIVITPIKVKGDTKTYFQAEAFFSGKQVSDKDVYSLAVAA